MTCAQSTPLASSPLTGKLVVEPLRCALTPAEAMAVLADQAGVVLLESSAAHPQWGRHSILTCRPIRTVQLTGDRWLDSAGLLGHVPIMEGLDKILEWVRAPALQGCSCAAGWIGYLGYELGRHIERLPCKATRDTALPDAHLAFYDALAICDAVTGDWQLVSLQFDGLAPAGAGQSARMLRATLESAISGSTSAQSSPAALRPRTAVSNFSRGDYLRAVQQCIDYIAAGDIFQVNLSQRFTVQLSEPPVEIYRRLRLGNPSCYGGYLAGDGWAVLSSSPELFLRLQGRHVLTRPIKGTRPRTGQAEHDARAARELQASVKDNAELAMIIDLLRNDLGRVCRFGSVKVLHPAELEWHSSVLHLVGTVVGELREGPAGGVGRADLIGATFPGGSITGAPKIRAMEIIDELEPIARNVYTGSLGHFGVDGSAELNIAIRTIVCENGRAHVQAGGGIVADSTPQGEYLETLAKAAAPLRALGAAADECQ